MCLNSLLVILLVILIDEDVVVFGLLSLCNIKCLGDVGESCFKISCCGGLE